MPTTSLPSPGGGSGALKSLARIFRERASFEMREEEVEALGAEVEKASLGGGSAAAAGGGAGPAAAAAGASSSSPPAQPAVQLPPIAADAARLQAEAAEDEAWQAAHPNALSSFEAFAATVLAGKRPAVFLDYDGTLTPIVRDPDAATLAPAMRRVVAALARVFPTAIVSGRGREKVESFVRLPELYYAGSHGMDIVGPAEVEAAANAAAVEAAAAGGGNSAGATPPLSPAASSGSLPSIIPPPARAPIAFRPAAEFAPLMDAAHAALAAAVAPIPGAAVEHNTFAVSVHYRNVDPAAWDDVAASVSALLAAPAFAGKLRAGRGRKVLEVRPTIDWDKGKALAHLLTALGLGKDGGENGGSADGAAATSSSSCPPSSSVVVAPDVAPIYLGDDRTDEDAFSALAAAGVGAGVLVAARPRPTAAGWSLADPGEVLAFLARLASWGAALDGGSPGRTPSGWHAAPACTGWRMRLEGLTLPPLLDAAAARAAVAGVGRVGGVAAVAAATAAAAAAAAGSTSPQPPSPASALASRAWPLAPDSPATAGRPPRPPSSADGGGNGGGPRRTSSGSGAAAAAVAASLPPRPTPPPSPPTTASQLPDESTTSEPSDATSPAGAARAALAALRGDGGDGGGGGGSSRRPPPGAGFG